MIMGDNVHDRSPLSGDVGPRTLPDCLWIPSEPHNCTIRLLGNGVEPFRYNLLDRVLIWPWVGGAQRLCGLHKVNYPQSSSPKAKNLRDLVPWILRGRLFWGVVSLCSLVPLGPVLMLCVEGCLIGLEILCFTSRKYKDIGRMWPVYAPTWIYFLTTLNIRTVHITYIYYYWLYITYYVCIPYWPCLLRININSIYIY